LEYETTRLASCAVTTSDYLHISLITHLEPIYSECSSVYLAKCVYFDLHG